VGLAVLGIMRLNIIIKHYLVLLKNQILTGIVSVKANETINYVRMRFDNIIYEENIIDAYVQVKNVLNQKHDEWVITLCLRY
jgi:predicted RNA methylase